MSLSLALDQIQRPTWWTFEQHAHHGGFKIKTETVERRQKFLDHLKAAGRKVETKELETTFGLKNGQVWHILNQLIAEGLVKKYTPRRSGYLVELAK